MSLAAVCSFGPGLGLCALVSGCSTPEMKGTPFYSGEYGARRGPAEQRVNVWPLCYYREPALSVLWPILEFTDDHWAVRPLFSVYGLDRTNREYNVFWPLAQLDRADGAGRVFPVFWGNDYRVVLPLYWHIDHPWGAEGGTDALFPLWIYHRERTNQLSLWSPWPLFHRWHDLDAGEQGSMAFPFYWYNRDRYGSLFLSLPWMSGADAAGDSWQLLTPLYYHVSNATSSAWVTPLWMSGANAAGDSWQLLTPLYYHNSNATSSTWVTPLWAKGHSETNDWQAVIPFAYWDREQRTLLSPLWAHWRRGESETWMAPWLLSWQTHTPQHSELWLAGALAHASWGAQPGSHHLFPFYYRNAKDETFLTPLCGWDNTRGFRYPLTPLVGVRTKDRSGSWLFPLYSYAQEKKTGDVAENVLLLGGHKKNRTERHTWFYPVFSQHNYGPLESKSEVDQRFGRYGTEFWCAPFCWYEKGGIVGPSAQSSAVHDDQALSSVSGAAPPTNAPLVRTYLRKNGAFPFWSYANRTAPTEGRQEITGSCLLALYDYRHELELAPNARAGTINDYTRARVLWRLWHYERLNGDVSVDVFPTFTYDRKTDGFRKVSFLWRFFRYERAPGGLTKVDLFFIPVRS